MIGLPFFGAVAAAFAAAAVAAAVAGGELEGGGEAARGGPVLSGRAGGGRGVGIGAGAEGASSELVAAAAAAAAAVVVAAGGAKAAAAAPEPPAKGPPPPKEPISTSTSFPTSDATILPPSLRSTLEQPEPELWRMTHQSQRRDQPQLPSPPPPPPPPPSPPPFPAAGSFPPLENRAHRKHGAPCTATHPPLHRDAPCDSSSSRASLCSNARKKTRRRRCGRPEARGVDDAVSPRRAAEAFELRREPGDGRGHPAERERWRRRPGRCRCRCRWRLRS